MVSRRRFLGYSAAALTAPFWAQAISAPFASAAPESMKFVLQNNSGGPANAYIAGFSDAEKKAVFIKKDGTPYFPEAGGPEPAPIGDDVAIPVDGTVEVTVPRMYGARVYFVRESKIDFYVNPGPALVEPALGNTADTTYGKVISFCEFTFNDVQLFVNVSYVDPSRQRYVSVSGRATLSRDSQQMGRLWSSAHREFFPQGLDDPDLARGTEADVERSTAGDACDCGNGDDTRQRVTHQCRSRRFRGCGNARGARGRLGGEGRAVQRRGRPPAEAARLLRVAGGAAGCDGAAVRGSAERPRPAPASSWTCAATPAAWSPRP